MHIHVRGCAMCVRGIVKSVGARNTTFHHYKPAAMTGPVTQMRVTMQSSIGLQNLNELYPDHISHPGTSSTTPRKAF